MFWKKILLLCESRFDVEGERLEAGARTTSHPLYAVWRKVTATAYALHNILNFIHLFHEQANWCRFDQSSAKSPSLGARPFAGRYVARLEWRVASAARHDAYTTDFVALLTWCHIRRCDTILCACEAQGVKSSNVKEVRFTSRGC